MLTIYTFVSDSNLSIPHHTDAVFKIRNTSKFSSYFSGKQDVEEEEKEQFSKWSKEFMLTSDKNISPASSDLKSGAAYIFNNKKLKAPRLAKLIPLKLTDVYDKQVREHNNWFRFYFEKDEMNKSGKGQRIAVVLDKSKGSFVYENYFKSNDWISKAGTDIVTVNPSLKLPGTSVVRNNIIIDEKITGEKYYDLFQPLYHGKNDPNETLELMSYLPVYDSVQDLWYIDIGFDFRSVKKKEVHTVFAQLNFVNFQPFSANYNVDTTGYSDSKSGYELDYRFSTPAQADFISVFPSRQYKNHWSLLKKNADEAFVFTVQTESLYFKADKLLTQFFVSVQKKQAGDFWTTIASTKSLSQSPAFFHPLLNTTLTPSTSIAEAKFSLDWKDTGTVRAVIMEVDYFNEEKGLDALQAHIDTISKNGGGYDVSDIPGVWVRNIFIISK